MAGSRTLQQLAVEGPDGPPVHGEAAQLAALRTAALAAVAALTQPATYPADIRAAVKWLQDALADAP